MVKFDYIEVFPSRIGRTYVLMDAHLDYKWTFTLSKIAVDSAAQILMDCCAAYGVPEMLVSNEPTLFKNETIAIVCKNLEKKTASFYISILFLN